MDKFNEILTNHISNWNMVWFGLIFWGSVINAIAEIYLINNYSVLCYLFGLLLGLIAKIRGTWIWKI
ncbi:MAG: hypothetical protein H8E55_37440 [Pelagibacterales bacterium]|jgi:hypothetical protein|nr:hypothetical protein [Pelagibacterales bacterium]MBT4926680.1 hypothetical protein [bacterium]MDA8798527.1 hypothetical protein [Gammaproteobacteria bacterium]MDA9965378.1 hypothetical protein [Gammaproteobacteria bacterium]MDC0918664.1 hypothetical protein [Gammaproteobacteria bacterium]